MTKRIKDYLIIESSLDKDKQGRDLDRKLQVAIVAVLCFMGHVDKRFVSSEFDTIIRAIGRQFHFMDDESAYLIEIASVLLKDPTKIEESIALLNEHLSDEQRKLVLEMAWNVALADGHVEASEENLWKILQGTLNIYT